MKLPPEILQFLASLGAIIVLAWLAHILRLGRASGLKGKADVQRAAAEAVDGYEPSEWAIDQDGRGAIMRDAQGRILLLKQHGNKFAGRILGPAASARATGKYLAVASGERRFGAVTLAIEDTQAWVDAVNELRKWCDA